MWAVVHVQFAHVPFKAGLLLLQYGAGDAVWDTSSKGWEWHDLLA